MRMTQSKLRKVIRKVISESDRFHGILPQELWEISDYEDYLDSGIILRRYSDEELQMKIEQIEEEIEDEKNYMDDPQNQYDSAIAPKESLINAINGIIGKTHIQGPMNENFTVYSERGNYIEAPDGELLKIEGPRSPRIIVGHKYCTGSIHRHPNGKYYLTTSRYDEFFSSLQELCDHLNEEGFNYEGIDDRY